MFRGGAIQSLIQSGAHLLGIINSLGKEEQVARRRRERGIRGTNSILADESFANEQVGSIQPGLKGGDGRERESWTVLISGSVERCQWPLHIQCARPRVKESPHPLPYPPPVLRQMCSLLDAPRVWAVPTT